MWIFVRRVEIEMAMRRAAWATVSMHSGVARLVVSSPLVPCISAKDTDCRPRDPRSELGCPHVSQEIAGALRAIQTARGLARKELAVKLGASLASVTIWLDGTATPSPATAERILEIMRTGTIHKTDDLFASTGINLIASTGSCPQELGLVQEPM